MTDPSPPHRSRPDLQLREAKELGSISQRLKNMTKTAVLKTAVVQSLHPDLSKNKLVAPEGSEAAEKAAVNSRSKSAKITDMVAPTEPPPPPPPPRKSDDDDDEEGDNDEQEPDQTDSFQAFPIKIPAISSLHGDDESAAAVASATPAGTEVSDTTATAILERIYNTGIPVMKNLGGSFIQFCKEFEQDKKDFLERVARGEILPDGSIPGEKDVSEMTTNDIKSAMAGGKMPDQELAVATAAKKSAGKRKISSAGVAAKKAASSNIPSKFSKRYPNGSLPLYGQTDDNNNEEEAAAAAARQKQKQLQRTGHNLDFGKRWLDIHIPSHRMPDFAFKYYLSMYVKGVDQKLDEYMMGDLKNTEPTLVRWTDIQEYAYLEALTDEEACSLGYGCIGHQLTCPTGSFAFRKWKSPDRRIYKYRPKKDPSLCYADMLLVLNLMKDYERRSGRCSAGKDSPFKYLVDVPGEYNKSAFRQCVDGNNEGTTRPIRHFVLSQLRFSEQTYRDPVKGTIHRKFVERQTLQCRDCSTKILSMPLVNPSSYTTFDIAPMTNERILLMFIFRDMTERFRYNFDRELPEQFKACRLAFIPFEDGLKLLGDKKFRDEYLPKDFMTNPQYILKNFDIISLPHSGTKALSRPSILDGHYVFWLAHIRINAALELIETGLDILVHALVTAPTKSGSAGGEGPQNKSPDQASVASASVNASNNSTAATSGQKSSYPIPKSAQIPASSGSEPRVWISSSNMQSLLSNEVEGIRAKLAEYVKGHNKLITFLQTRMLAGDPIHDDAILPVPVTSENVSVTPTPEEEKVREIWLSIKPDSNYLGPYFPEDRRYIEYIQKPKVVMTTPPGQLAHYYLSKWCIGVVDASKVQQQQPQILIGCLLTEKTEHITWTISRPPSMTYLPGDDNPPNPLFFCFPGSKGSVLDLQLIFGDFRAFVWWIQNQAEPDILSSLYQDCGGFERFGWNYKAHPKAAKALADGTWFKGADKTRKTSYVILMSLLVVVHCATIIMTYLQRLYELRLSRFGDKLAAIKVERSVMYHSIVSKSPKDILYYDPDQASLPPKRERLEQLHESMRALNETIYQVHKFINSHLPLAHAMVVNCTNEKGEGPTDANLTAVDSEITGVKCVVGSSAPSLYELFYPYGGAQVMCEEHLVDCATRESYLKFISDTSTKDPLIEGQTKATPARCHTRDTERRIARIVFSNAAYSRYCALNLYCTMLGAYRHCKTRPRFEKSLQVFGKYGDLERVDLFEVNTFLKKHKFIALNTLRENMVFHIRNNEAFHQAVIMSFQGYRAFEDSWLQECTDSIRQMFDQGIPMATIDANICSIYGKNTPFVYRRLKTDFYKYIWNRVKDVLCRRLVGEFMHLDEFTWPDVLALSKESIQYLIQVVKNIDPESDAFDYGTVLSELGCSDNSIVMIKTVEATFAKEGQIPAMESMLDTLDEKEHLLIFAFFHLLRSRCSIRVLDLTRDETEAQIEAITKRAGVSLAEPLPISNALIHFCSIAACNKRKTPVIQEKGNRYFGNSDVAWNLETNSPVCKPKKPPKSSSGKSGGSKRSGQKRKKSSAVKQKKNNNKVPDQDSVVGGGGSDSDDSGDEEEKEHNHNDGEDSDDDDEDGESGKSLPVAIREFTNKAKQITEKRKSSKSSSVSDASTTPSAQDPKLAEWSKKLEELRENVFKAAKKEANRFVRRIFDLPCEDAVLDSYCTIGKVIERSFIKEKTDVECYTHCPLCGCATVFRTDMVYANGILYSFIVSTYN